MDKKEIYDKLVIHSSEFDKSLEEEFAKRISSLTPYTFEELEENMYVDDIKDYSCVVILKKLPFNKLKIGRYTFCNYYHGEVIDFEEKRFYPQIK